MNFTKTKAGFLIILVIILGVFNAIAFMIPFVRLGSFWAGYGFTMLALVLCFAASGYAFRGETMQSKFYGLPMPVVLLIYIIIQLILGFVFMAFISIPVWVSVLACGLLLACCLIGLIAYDLTKDAVERIDSEIKQKTFYIKSLQADVEGMVNQTEDPLLRKALKELVDAIRYSDPMSADALSSLENKIEAKTAELGELIASNSVDAAKTLCAQIQNIVAERNRKCKVMK